MRSYRYIFVGLLSIIGCSLIVMFALARSESQTMLPMGAFVVGLLALIGVVFGCWGTIGAMDSLFNKLKNNRTDPDALSLEFAAAPEITHMTELVSQLNEQLEASEETNHNLTLQLQLLQKDKRNTEAIIYSIRDAVIVIDAFDRIVMANGAAEELFNFQMGNSSLKPLGDIINNPEFVKYIVQSRKSKTSHRKHEFSFDKGPEAHVFDCIISCVKDDKNAVTGVVTVLHDITREREIAQMKNDFVSHVSHELKTPLASINAYAEMLVDGEAGDQETIDNFCSIIQNQAQRLNRLIEDILNISRIESGMTKIKKEQLSLALLIEQAEKMIQSYAAEKDITVTAPPAIIFDQIYADKDMISQVIINLLSNAVKYTESGGSVTINTEVDDSDKIIRVTVSDTGVGIPPEDVDHVFDKFYRVQANNKYAKGTGLGLNLVKQIVEKVHDGRVFVTSTPGQGSTFGFELPLASRCLEPAK